jgi:hypothetical protein
VKRIGLSGLSFVLLLGLAACGGSGTSLYSLQKTKSCLTANHIRLGGTLDFVATTATGGALRAHLPGEFVTIAFGATTADADNIDQAYRSFHAQNVGIDDVLREDRNAVMLWHVHPSDAEIATITSCLK